MNTNQAQDVIDRAINLGIVSSKGNELIKLSDKFIDTMDKSLRDITQDIKLVNDIKKKFKDTLSIEEELIRSAEILSIIKWVTPISHEELSDFYDVLDTIRVNSSPAN